MKLENVSYHQVPMSGKATITVEELDDNSKYSCEIIIADQDDQTELVRAFLTPEQRIALASHLAYLPDQAKMNFTEMAKEVKAVA